MERSVFFASPEYGRQPADTKAKARGIRPKEASMLARGSAVALALLVQLSVAARADAERVLLRKDTSFFVGAGGHDENGCTSAHDACATLQHVMTKLYQDYDLGCRKVTINVLPGSAIAGADIEGVMPGQCRLDDLLIVGDASRRLATAADPYPYDRTITSSIIARGGARLRVEGVRLTTTEGPALGADDGLSRLEAGFVDFGPVATYHAVAGVHARLKMTHDYTISGGGVGHASAPVGQFQILPGVSVRFITSETQRVHWSTAFIIAIEMGLINLSYADPASVPAANRVRFLNADGLECSQAIVCATGQRWGAALNSVIYTGGGLANPYWLPGDQPADTQGINRSADSVAN